MLRNISSNWALALIQALVLLALTSIQIGSLGASVQGAWLLMASLTSILGLLVLGVPMASVRFIAVHVAKKEIRQANDAIATCLGVCLGLGMASLMVGGGLSFALESYLHQEKWQSLGLETLREARLAYWILVAQISLGFAGQLPFGILDAHEDFVSRNGVKLAGLVARCALIVGVLRTHPSLVVLGVIQASVTLLEFVVALSLIRRNWPGIRFGLRGFGSERLRQILGFSLYTMLLNMGTQLAFQSDQLVISGFESPDNGAYFDVGNKFFPPLLGIILGIGMVVMPMAAKLQVTGRLDELRDVFLKWSKVAYSITLVIAVYLIVLAPEFIGWWVGPAFAEPSSKITRVLLPAFLVYMPVRGVGSPILVGLGKPRAPALSLLFMGVVNLALSVVLAGPYGITGVAIGTAVPCIGYAVGVAILTCRELEVSYVDYLRYVMAPPTLGALAPLLLLVWLKYGVHLFVPGRPRLVAFIPLFVAGVGMLAVFAVMWIAFVYRNDPYVDLASRLERFTPAGFRKRMP